ncbi:MAG: hypothetical protein AAGA55_03535 [Planctomycetota bacterium]
MSQKNAQYQVSIDATPANRFGLDYRAEARRIGPPVCPIVDAHAHINGARASAVYRDVCDLYGVERVYSQSQLANADAVREVLGSRVRFVAIPEYMHPDRKWAFTEGFVENLDAWHAHGARMVKFWGAPRLRDFTEQLGLDPSELALFDSDARLMVAERARSLGMSLMVHVADPDTWFKTMYEDASRYGTKRDQYDSLSRLLEQTGMNCLGAHMGGWPEDLGFLREFLERHPRLVLDTSATKWIVRELSAHPREELLALLEDFSGRILFGSDIVTSDEHLSETESNAFGSALAASENEAFDLYASRYWALRMMFETDYRGESPIADPDLHKVDPDRYTEMDAPVLVGRSLPGPMLEMLYRGAVERTLDVWYGDGASLIGD